MNFYTDLKVHLSLDKIAWMNFIDEKEEEFCRNLCREGLKKIPRAKV